MPIDSAILGRHAGAMIAHLPQVVTMNGASVPCAVSSLSGKALAQRDADFVVDYALSVTVRVGTTPPGWSTDHGVIFEQRAHRIIGEDTAPDRQTVILHLASPHTARLV